MCYCGPNGARRTIGEFDPLSDDHFGPWYDDKSGKHKYDTMASDILFYTRVIRYFSVYFRDFKACACRMRLALFDHRGELRQDVSHDDLIEILRDTNERRLAQGWLDAIETKSDVNPEFFIDQDLAKKYMALINDQTDQKELGRLRRYAGAMNV